MRNLTHSLLRSVSGKLTASFFVALGLSGSAAHAQPLPQLPLAQPGPAAHPPAAHPPAAEVRAYTLADCIQLGMERQPALHAARASLASAQAGSRGLDNLKLAGLISREIPIRRQQADLGVSIAAANLQQVEGETVYAITRTYFTVIYARKQHEVVRGVVDKLESARRRATDLEKRGDPDVVITKIDIERLSVNLDLARTRQVETSQGILRATAALREAIGLGPDCPLVVAEDDLPPINEGFCKEDLVRVALARRSELAQASTFAQVADLEIRAQHTAWIKPSLRTFAIGADIHAKPIPQGYSNAEYRPGAIGPEMPVTFAGKREDRVQRARDLAARAGSVVEKTQNLIVLEAEDAFYRWEGAAQRVRLLSTTPASAAKVARDVQARFDIGKVSGEDLIRAQTLEDQAQASLNEALFQQALALAALERITAGGFCPSYRAPAVTRP